MSESEHCCEVPVAKVSLQVQKTRRSAKATAREMGNPVNQAPTRETILSWYSLTAVTKHFGTPLWDSSIVKNTYDEIKSLISSGTSAPPLDLLSLDCFTKAAHMTQWYKNTMKLWEQSLQMLDFGAHARKQTQEGLEGALSVGSQSRLVGRLWAYAEHGLMEKFLKWSTATLWAAMLHQTELPPCPDFVRATNGERLVFLFDHPTWVQLCSSTQKAKGKKEFSQVVRVMIILTKDLYMTKNASLAVDDSFVEENLEKHKKIMCKPREEDPLSTRMERLIIKSIQQCSDDIFGPLPTQDEKKIVQYNQKEDTYTTKTSKHSKSIPLEARPPSRLPSLGASVNCGRHLGGAVGDLLKHHGEKYTLPEPEDGYLHSYCTYRTEYVDVRTPHDPELYTEAENSSRKAAYARLKVQAQVVPLLEAFKVRTITKGDADQYHLARRWQKVIHGKMRRQTNCRLIGQPCNSAILSQTFGNSPYFTGDGFFVSGDYESATDLLHPFLSEVANEAICQRLRVPLEDQWVLKQCLTGHELKYSSKGAYHDQQWGQLMGSPSSFPILCLINLAATKVAYEEYFRSIGLLGKKEYCVLEELPMVVNGDDILYWCYSQEHYSIWKEVTKQCGLKFSLGKNYTHKRVAIINSELYFFNPQPKPQCLGVGGKMKTCAAYVSTLFSRQGTLQPYLLFGKQTAVNSRLLIGGQRSSGKGPNGYCDISLMSDRDLEILEKGLREKGIGPKTYAAVKELTPRQQQSLKNQTGIQQLHTLRNLQRREVGRRTDNLEEYIKWRTTLEARQMKGLEMLAGDSHLERARPAMMRAFSNTFRKIQMAKLADFRKIGLSKADVGTPHFIPQSHGGLGLIPPPDHEFTAMDYLEVATLEGCPQSADDYLRRITPRMPRPDFMQAVTHELSLQQDLLAIKTEFKEVEDIGLLRFLGEEDGFWEHSFLTGFITQDGMIVDSQEKGDAYVQTRDIQRSYKSSRLVREKVRQFKQGVILGIWKKVKEGGKSKVVATEEFSEQLLRKPIWPGKLLRKFRPSPKYE
nr:MAG: putative RNA polymerase [Eriocheir sinensis botourmia-like virus 2]